VRRCFWASSRRLSQLKPILRWPTSTRCRCRRSARAPRRPGASEGSPHLVASISFCRPSRRKSHSGIPWEGGGGGKGRGGGESPHRHHLLLKALLSILLETLLCHLLLRALLSILLETLLRHLHQLQIQLQIQLVTLLLLPLQTSRAAAHGIQQP